MRVLHVDSGRIWRGGQNQVRLLARELLRAPDVEQRLVTRRASELARRAAADGVPVAGTPWLLGPDPVALLRLLIELADTVTEMTVVKHAYQRGIRARKGIEY